jgi:DNA invertase Pin-like site-specific DNA recombinase
MKRTKKVESARVSKAFSYLRVSGKGQIDGDGFPRQREAVTRFANSRAIEIAGEFRDEGVSGTADSFERPGLSDLFIAIRSNGVRAIIVERSDRLARDLMVGEIILAEARKLGVIVLTSDGVDLTVGDDNPTSILIRQILGAVAQFDKSITVQKLRASRNRKRRDTGRCEGVKPFGYLPGEQVAIARIKGLMRKTRGENRRSPAAIAEALNAEEISSRSGKPWSRSTVYKILRSFK